MSRVPSVLLALAAACGAGEGLPPGQTLIEDDRFPIFAFRGVPEIDPVDWSPSLYGLVEHDTSLTWDDVTSLSIVEDTLDLHCVTGWSRRGIRAHVSGAGVSMWRSGQDT